MGGAINLIITAIINVRYSVNTITGIRETDVYMYNVAELASSKVDSMDNDAL